MKLRLDPKEKTPTLEITETISPNDVAVLRAGVRKLFKSGKKEVLLDLTQIAPPRLTSPEMILALKSLQLVAADEKAVLVVISPVVGVGTAPTRADALTLLNSPDSRLLNREAQLQASLDVLEATKAAAEAQLATLASETDALLTRRNHSALKQEILRLTSDIETWLNNRPASSTPRPQDSGSVIQTIQAILKKQGLLK